MEKYDERERHPSRRRAARRSMVRLGLSNPRGVGIVCCPHELALIRVVQDEHSISEGVFTILPGDARKERGNH